MKIKIDHDKIAEGLWSIIKTHPHGACISLGMLPADIMEAFEANLKRKIPDHFIDTETLTEHDGRETRQETVHTVCCKIYALAKKKGVLRV